MNEIQNTTQFIKDGGAYLLLAQAMGGETPDQIIGDMEASGQRQLVASQQLPTNTRGTDAEFEALGFAFGDPAQGDPMFRAATLPPGWTKRASDHDMWSYIDDELGRERVSIFYKAAFYDRSAFMDLTSVGGYLHSCVYYGRPIVTDETWATAAALRTAALEHAESERERVALYERTLAREDAPSYAAEELANARAKLAVYVALAAQHSESADA